MKLSVHIRGEVIAVPCGKGTDTIRHLGEQALKRYTKLRASSSPTSDQIQEIRKKHGGAILDPDDAIKDVLDDNDFVQICKSQYSTLSHYSEFANNLPLSKIF